MTRALYTEADFRALPEGATVHVGDHDLVTPAALDVAHERGLRLVRGGAPGGTPCGAGAGGSAKKRDCLWHKVLATPGKYLVEVSAGGDAAVWQLGDHGPVAFGRDNLENHG